MAAAVLLHKWTGARIRAECHRSWLEYDKAKRDRYIRFFKEHPEFAHPSQTWSARDIESALPPGWSDLANLIPTGRHSQHLSGKSSQLLALALLGVSATLDRSHGWVWEAFGPLKPASLPVPRATFEMEVDEGLLNEYGKKRTSIDYLVEDAGLVVSIECKWREDGIGACSCANFGGNPDRGACRDVIRDRRPAYWDTAREVFHLPERVDGQPCPLSPVYQAVRNIAAALKLAEPSGEAVFALIYDAQNPYFAGQGEWPGWAAVLRHALVDEHHPRARFRAVSWQELMPSLVLDEDTRMWALEKHGLS